MSSSARSNLFSLRIARYLCSLRWTWNLLSNSAALALLRLCVNSIAPDGTVMEPVWRDSRSCGRVSPNASVAATAFAEAEPNVGGLVRLPPGARICARAPFGSATATSFELDSGSLDEHIPVRILCCWAYERKTPGQGTSPGSIRSLNRDSNPGYPANIPHRIERRECAKGRACGGWMHSPPSRPLGDPDTATHPRPPRRSFSPSSSMRILDRIEVAARSPTGRRRTRAPAVRVLMMAERSLGVACLSALRNGAKPVLGKDLVRCLRVLLLCQQSRSIEVLVPRRQSSNLKASIRLHVARVSPPQGMIEELERPAAEMHSDD